MHWPQITLLVFIVLDIIAAIFTEGSNIQNNLLGKALLLWLLTSGGFFAQV
jgi:hypothetical protein